MKRKLIIASVILATLTLGGCLVISFGGRHAAEEIVLPRVSQRLGAKLQWSGVTSSFGNLIVEELRITIPELPELEITIGRLEVGYRLWPLLSGDVEISQVVLDTPAIKLSKVDSTTIVRVREKWRSLRQNNSSESSVSSASGGELNPRVEINDGTLIARDFAGTTLEISEMNAILAEHGRFEIHLVSSTVIENDGERPIGRIGEVSVIGIRDSVIGIDIDEATIEGAEIRWNWNQQENPLVETFRDYREMFSGESSEDPSAESQDLSSQQLFSSVQFPSTVRVSSSHAELVLPLSEDEEERVIELAQVQGQLSLGTDDQPPSVELLGKLNPGQGRFGLSATINENGLTSTRVQLTSLHIGQLATGLSLSGAAFDEGSVLDADVTVEQHDHGVLRFRGELSTAGVTVRDPLLASETITGLRVRTVANGQYLRQADTLELEEAHLWLNGVETRWSGQISRQDERMAFDLLTELYPIHCGELRDATPAALRQDLAEMEFDGVISGRARLAVDTEDLENLVLELELQNGCRAIGRGRLDIERLYGAFTHRVELPDDEIYEFRAGPGSGNWASLDGISPFMIAAVMTTEDGRFYFHNGFTLTEIRRALIRDIRAGRPRFGASTITMQLSRNLFLGRERTLARKIQEAVLTWYLEENLSKDEILALYFNIIEYGPHIFGIRHATTHYFGRQPDDLSPREAAFIAKLLPSPVARHNSTYDAGQLSPRFRNMVDRLLGVMRERRALTPGEHQTALDERIVFYQPSDPFPVRRPWLPRPPFLDRQRGSDRDEPPERWLEVDMDAYIPAPAELRDDIL